MKLFGSKDDQPQEDVFAEEVDGAEVSDESFEASSDESFDDNAGGALSAPSRDLHGGGGKSKKGLMLGLLALLLAGGGGGAYYYMMMMEQPPATPRVAKVLGGAQNAAPAAQAQATSAGAVPPTVDVTADILGAPPMPQVPADAAQDPLLAAAAAPLDTGMPADAGAMPAPDAAAPIDAFGEMPPADVAVPVDAAAAPVSAPAPDAETAAPVAPAPDALATVPDMPDEAPLGDSFAPVSAPADTAATATEIAAPKEDLPMPHMLETPAPAQGAAQISGDGAVTGATTAAPAAAQGQALSGNTATAPSNAEKAIVENAAVLDQLSAPAAATAADPAAAGRTINEILGGGQDAIVRPMPDSYVVVRKETDGSALAARLKQARTALMGNNDMAALQMFNEMYQDYPRDGRVAMGRALSMQKLGQYDMALTAYEEILEKDPKNLEALTNMLGILKQQNPSLALEKLSELREAYPFNADIAAQLGVAYAGMQSYSEALKYFDIADALKPGNGYVMYNRAVALDRMGQEEKAAAVYRLIVRLAAEGALKEPVPVEAIRQRLSTMR
ncbi:MAG TPA: tetratricopeptide repeat protein [Alphaproteobacteria bacterium]|nr:tetratricopeptide repeat protein [Alphaproteobacteria bacterium]